MHGHAGQAFALLRDARLLTAKEMERWLETRFKDDSVPVPPEWEIKVEKLARRKQLRRRARWELCAALCSTGGHAGKA